MSNSAYDFSISYSARKLYLTCPKQYYFRYILKDGSKGDPRDTMFGSIIGKLFEWFYEQRLWADSDPYFRMRNLVNEAISDVFAQEGYVRGTNHEYESKLREDLNTYLKHGIDTIRSHKLLAPNTKAELDLTTILNLDGFKIRMVGRADFVYDFGDQNFWITDGKASKHREKYVDSKQLVWYGLSHFLKFGVAPKRMGFIFWMFPVDPISWVSYTSDDMRQCAKETKEVALKILDKEFTARASGDCHRCLYKNKCDEGVKYLASRRKDTTGIVTNSFFDVEHV